MTRPNRLVGKAIAAVYIATDRKAMKFVLDDGIEILARTDGDCCSVSWIEHVENADALAGAVVVETRDIRMPTFEERDGELKFYGFQITTNKGTCVIDYRNESNGYYGGCLVWGLVDSDFDGGVYGQNKSTMEWRPL